MSNYLGFDMSFKWVDGVGIGESKQETDEERKERLHKEAEDWYALRLHSYIGQFGRFW